MAYETTNLSIKKWAEEDRPREKMLLKGRHVLSDAELLAILMGSGYRSMSAVELAKHILSEFNNNLNELAQCTVTDLKKFKGVGEAKAITIISALELGRRRKEVEITKKPIIKQSADVYHLLKSDFADLDHEEFWILLLKRNNEVIKKVNISKGGVTGTVVDARLIFKPAIEELASGVIMAHNHPSGGLKPSHADLDITKKIKQAGDLLDIKLLDHLIITEAGYYSFADEGNI